MKIRVTLKDPDTMHDAVDNAYKRAKKPDVSDLSAAEWRGICDIRAADAKDDITERWMNYGEYLTVEFDTEANTATVIPNGKLR